MALYHTYRPQSFDDLLGQPHVRAVLASAIATGRVGHAYLFSGPRGVGKTSVARILAKAINCEASSKRQSHNEQPNQDLTIPCNRCQACLAITEGSALDVIEIDAASNRGIDEIRELRDRVRFAPTSLAKKVYIIDEVHMLTKEAFNALLKTLEEPPPHAVFVLATTELAKIPETILSRCQQLQFRRATPDALAHQLQSIAEREGYQLNSDALEVIVSVAEGSYRDALSAFEQVLVAASTPTIAADHVRTILGMPSEETALDILAAVGAGSRPRLLEVIEQSQAAGVSLEALTGELIRTARKLLFVVTLGSSRASGGSAAFQAAVPILTEQLSEGAIVQLLRSLCRASDQLKTSPLPALPLELALLELIPTPQLGELPRPTAVPAAREDSIPSIVIESIDESPMNDPGTAAETASPEATPPDPDPVAAPVPSSPSERVIDADQWRVLQQSLAERDPKLALIMAALRAPTIRGDLCILEVPFKFHADRLHAKATRALLGEVLSRAVGQVLTVSARVNPTLRSGRTRDHELSLPAVVADPVAALREL